MRDTSEELCRGAYISSQLLPASGCKAWWGLQRLVGAASLVEGRSDLAQIANRLFLAWVRICFLPGRRQSRPLFPKIPKHRELLLKDEKMAAGLSHISPDLILPGIFLLLLMS